MNVIMNAIMNAFTDVIIDAIMKNCLRKKKSEQRKICRTKKLIAFENRSDFIFDCILTVF